MQRDMQIQGTN